MLPINRLYFFDMLAYNRVTMRRKQFIEYVRDQIESAGGKFRLSDSKYVLANGWRCGGYLEAEPDCLELAVATKKPEKIWLEVLVHEFSHFQQYKENCHAWRSCYLPDGTDSGEIYINWVEGKEYDMDLIKHCLAKTRNMELDCERRTVANIIEFDLPIDIEAYCKKASAYVHLYNHMVTSRSWYKQGKGPYSHKEILDVMPDNLDGRYDRFPKYMKELYDRLCL